jgi:hypothetical protein
MKKESHFTQRELEQQKDPQSTRTALVLSGNASVDGARQRGWFIGHFLESTYDLRSTSSIELKWSIHRTGEEKSLWGVSKKATTLCVLLKGRISLLFPGAEYFLSREGDYVIWSTGLPHRWTVAADALVLTIRWPSCPEDYSERTQSEMARHSSGKDRAGARTSPPGRRSG